MQTAMGVWRRVAECRALIGAMAWRELRTRFVGTIGGLGWSFAAPLSTMLVYWFVFSVGLRVRPVGDVPFIAYFAAAFVPWLLFSDSVLASTGAVTENPHLVKKCRFPVEILPVVSIAAGLVTHGFLLLIVGVILMATGIPLTPSLLQLPYYLLAMLVLTTGFGWLVAALNVLFRDTREVVTVVLNLWFWMTPIVWPLDMVPERFAWMAKLNPLLYVVEGYRSCLLGGDPYWSSPVDAVRFWAMAGAILVAGAGLFGRMRTEFAEVL